MPFTKAVTIAFPEDVYAWYAKLDKKHATVIAALRREMEREKTTE